VNSKVKAKGTGRRALGVGTFAAFVLLSTSGLEGASVLWSNGTVESSASSQERCDSGLGTCSNPVGSTGSFTVFDNFSLSAAGAAVTGFDISDFFVGTPTNNYKSTTWSLWSGDPLGGKNGDPNPAGTLLASGSSVGAITTISGSSALLITVNLGATVFLTGGTYYLGTSNVLTNTSDQTVRALTSGCSVGTPCRTGVTTALATYEQSNGSIQGTHWSSATTPNNVDLVFPGGQGNSSTDTAFDILGGPVPEPGTLMLLGIAFAGLVFIRRRQAA
jgi:PEP-CTERM motif